MQDVKTISSNELLLEDTYLAIEDMDELEKTAYKAKVRARAKEVGVSVKLVDEMFKATEKMLKADEIRFKREQANENPIVLEVDNKGVPANTTENFIRVLREDPYFSSIKYNELSNCPEWHADNTSRRWSDADDARSRHYIEKMYGLSNINKYNDAIRIIFEERKYHPVKEIIESIEWDGIERIPHMLTLWLACEDTEYVREVSRLLFAGGIHRIYRPGCKFDDVPVLIGTNQGEGKSTFCRWLALEDRFFREVNEIEGQKGMEAIEGGWICEFSELLAVTKSKDVEAVKSYITRQTDHYRKPYDRHSTDVERQCVFIGTTNKAQFLTDKSGNRRFYPVEVASDGYMLLNAEKECRNDIRQCWAEALHLFKEGKLDPFANLDLRDVIREHQAAAVEDDYREGLISMYLAERTRTCCLDIWQNALEYGEYSKPTKKDSNEIVLILTKLGWKRSEKAEWYSSQYGTQRVFTRPRSKK